MKKRETGGLLIQRKSGYKHMKFSIDYFFDYFRLCFEQIYSIVRTSRSAISYSWSCGQFHELGVQIKQLKPRV